MIYFAGTIHDYFKDGDQPNFPFDKWGFDWIKNARDNRPPNDSDNENVNDEGYYK